MFSEAGLLLGAMYLYFRFWLVLWLFKNAVAATERSNNPAPIIMFGFISSVLLVWYLTKIGSVNSVGWMYAGICMALNRLDSGGLWVDARSGDSVGEKGREIPE